MTTNIALNKTFEVELDDNTTINVMVCLEVSTEDDTEDTQASQQIRCFTYDNVIEPLEDTLTELFTAEDMADSIGAAASGDMLTADDYPECAE
jgi:hypothetical protein